LTILCRRQHPQQQLERGDLSPCLSPSGFGSKEPYDFHLGNQISPIDIVETLHQLDMDHWANVALARLRPFSPSKLVL